MYQMDNKVVRIPNIVAPITMPASCPVVRPEGGGVEVVVESVECVAWIKKLLEVGVVIRIVCEDVGIIFGFYYIKATLA
jgi:hypothetical protein